MGPPVHNYLSPYGLIGCVTQREARVNDYAKCARALGTDA